MKTYNEMSVAADSHAHIPDLRSLNSNSRSIEQQNVVQINQSNGEITCTSSHPYKGFYTWLSSPQAIHKNRKMNNNIAVIAPTIHTT